MFNTGLFVLEVQKRPCLWNVKDSAHNDRQVKLRAWEQIAKKFNSSNDSICQQNITIEVLQRKWKHLRDYYIREKKRTSKVNSSIEKNRIVGSSVTRKRNSPLLEMLQFLNANRGTDIVEVTVERNVTEDNFYPENTEEEDKSLSEYEISKSGQQNIKKIEPCQSNMNPLADEDEDNSDKQFLASLLPLIRNMSMKERFQFRAQLMNPRPLQEPSISCVETEEKVKMPEFRKRQRKCSDLVEREFVNKEKSGEATPKRDEFTIYGEYVANKLRNIKNTHARHTAEFHINGILYKAEMGEYDGGSKDVMNTSRSLDSRGLSNAIFIESVMNEEDYSGDIVGTVIKTEDLE